MAAKTRVLAEKVVANPGRALALCLALSTVITITLHGFSQNDQYVTQAQTLTLAKDTEVKLKFGKTTLAAGTKVQTVEFAHPSEANVTFVLALIAGDKIMIDRRNFVETSEEDKKAIDDRMAAARAAEIADAKANDRLPMVDERHQRIHYKPTLLEIHLLTQDGRRALMNPDGSERSWDGKVNENVWVIPAGTKLEWVKNHKTIHGEWKTVVQHTVDGHTEQFFAENGWLSNGHTIKIEFEERFAYADDPKNGIRTRADMDPTTGESYFRIGCGYHIRSNYDGSTNPVEPIWVIGHPASKGNVLFFDPSFMVTTDSKPELDLTAIPKELECVVVPMPEPFTKEALFALRLKIINSGLKDSGYPTVKIPVTMREGGKYPYLWSPIPPLVDLSKPVKATTIYYPQELSRVNKDGPPGNYSGYATGREDVPSSDEGKEQAAWAALNTFRKAHGKLPLKWNEDMARSARYKSASMYVFQVFQDGIDGYSHDMQVKHGPKYILLEGEPEMFKRFHAGTRGSAIARMPLSRNPAVVINEIWGTSPTGHKEGMLKDEATEGAIGYINGHWTFHLGN